MAEHNTSLAAAAASGNVNIIHTLPIKPNDIFKPLQVQDNVLRATAINYVLEKLKRIEKENPTHMAILLPSLSRIVNDW